MFAYVVPGRLVYVNQPIESLSLTLTHSLPAHYIRQQTIQDPSHPERFLGQLESVQDLNHITVFLTGQGNLSLTLSLFY